MERFKQLSQQQMVVLGVVLVVVIAGVFYLAQGRTEQQAEDDNESVFEEAGKVIPTVDPSVKVTIEGTTEAIITVSSIPEGTEKIEYQIDYETPKGPEGLFGIIDVDGESEAEEKITFGTCSSGVCRYHEIEGNKVHAIFKFEGDYQDHDEKILETNIEL